MSTTHVLHPSEAILPNSGITNNPLVHAAIRFLPWKMKRIIYLSSAAAVGAKNQDAEDPPLAPKQDSGEQRLIRKLNQVLNLSTSDEAALKLPMYLSHLIWTDKQYYQPVINQLKNCECGDPNAVASATLMSISIPVWLRYASPEVIANDLLALFTKDNRIFKHSEFVATQTP